MGIYVGKISFFVGSNCVKNVDTRHESFSSKKTSNKKVIAKKRWQTYMKWTVDPNETPIYLVSIRKKQTNFKQEGHDGS